MLNVLIIFIPVVAMLFLDTYERELLDLLERGLVQQARMLQAALATVPELDAETGRRMLSALEQRHEARIRVVDSDGRLLADTSVIAAQATADPTNADQADVDDRSPAERVERDIEPLRESLLYRIASFPVRTVRRLLGAQDEPRSSTDIYDEDGGARLSGPEIQSALEGRYGAATRVSTGQVSVTLYSAVPIWRDGSVAGAVLVSQSTYRILQSLYAVRLDLFTVLIYGTAAAVVLSLFLSLTIIRPLRSLQREALSIVDAHGRLTAELPPTRRKDEIGALANALRDLTEQVRVHVREVEAFAADASHELRNPLASIRASCEVAMQTPDALARDRFLAQAITDVRRAERLLAGLRELSRIDAGTLDSDAEPLSARPLGELLSAVVTAIAERDGRHEYHLTVHDGAAQARVALPAWALERVLRNLTDNAAGFAPSGSAIEIVAAPVSRDAATAGLPADTTVKVSVADRGPGLRDTAAIFGRFTSDRSDRGDHLGLGLAIVASILTRYGGSVTAANRSDGAGAVFTVGLTTQA